ncbi:hypothetical protein LTR08_001787 [Meristemomyces frigidus]|nr:hypothetical protein LTR08_001787 [Meristemomyces frigidus]
MTGNETAVVASGNEPDLKLRSYQQEMLEASLRRNVIVAMDTGSGKTHIAIARILVELERSDPSKLIWFMTPSVALSEQQCEALLPYLSAYQVLSLMGKDGVDKWTDQRLWDAVLTNVRVVVGTPQVLADALTHGFVRMSRLALLVFDEAHRCLKKSPMNVIMQQFYHPSKSRAEAVPHILGLTASPVMSAKQGDLETVEANLNAITATPKHERHELNRYVYPPLVQTIIFEASESFGEVEKPSASPLCEALSIAVERYDFESDPYILEFREHGDEWSQKQVQKALQKRKTVCSETLRVLLRKSTTLYEQLGPAAAEWYITSNIRRSRAGVYNDTALLDIASKERHHLQHLYNDISKAAVVNRQPAGAAAMSDKLVKLISLLAQQASPTQRGIIFVEQRATVSALVHVLRNGAHIAANYDVAGFVGTSSFAGGKASIADLAEEKEQRQDLDDFRTGAKNLMVSTNVLEEGIDVAACNLVICFDLPKTLVSFVQRRGRARQKNSKYCLFIAESDWKTDPLKWQNQETKMKQTYMDELRQQDPVLSEDEGALKTRIYRVASTGALLTLENAKSHLYHFAAVSTSQASNYTDVRPEFHVDYELSENDTDEKGLPKKLWTASVTLPSFVHPGLRTASCREVWPTADAAIKDAAFEAYVALHKAGLLNDNLLPLIKDYGPEPGQEHVDQPSLVSVAERQSSWTRWLKTGAVVQWYATTVTIAASENRCISYEMIIPAPLAQRETFTLYWNEQISYTAALQPTCPVMLVGSNEMETLRHYTSVVLGAVYGSRMATGKDDFVVLLRPEHISRDDMQTRLNDVSGCTPASEYFARDHLESECGLVRNKDHGSRAFLSRRILSHGLASHDAAYGVVVTAFPKRRDFLHSVPERQDVNTAYTTEQTFDIGDCTVDNLPGPDALFAAFVPSIIHRIDVQLLARDLQTTILRDVGITDTAIIIEAISAPSAGEKADYNRLEYLGDTILKLHATGQVMAQHPTWPEGYLSMEKSRIVSNNTLAKAALKAGLDKYILTQTFTGSKWRPTYISDVLTTDLNSTRKMSSKTLADVVEALIGAAFVDGGLQKAYQCIATLLPNETWYSEIAISTTLTSDLIPCTHNSLGLLERLIGHHFSRPTLLVEAITHASLPSQRTGMSYERLEFFGDAVLDFLIKSKLHAHPRALEHWQMHGMHEALVNGIYLGYRCMDYGIEQDKFVPVDTGGGRLHAERSVKISHLHDYVRASGQLIVAKQQSIGAYERLGRLVEGALDAGEEYPWPDLYAMNPQKFFSDLVESVIGALYIDTEGDLAVCEAFVERLGILKHLRTMLDGRMKIMSPKERLGVAAGDRTVRYVTVAADGEDESRNIFSCAVNVGGQEVAMVDRCTNKAEAEGRAALEAVRALQVKLG